MSFLDKTVAGHVRSRKGWSSEKKCKLAASCSKVQSLRIPLSRCAYVPQVAVAYSCIYSSIRSITHIRDLIFLSALPQTQRNIVANTHLCLAQGRPAELAFRVGRWAALQRMMPTDSRPHS